MMDQMTRLQFLVLLVAVIIISFLVFVIRDGRPWVAALIIGVVFPISVVAKILIDLRNNPTSHNLFPFEIAIACIVSIPPAFVGAFLGAAMRRAMRRM